MIIFHSYIGARKTNIPPFISLSLSLSLSSMDDSIGAVDENNAPRPVEMMVFLYNASGAQGAQWHVVTQDTVPGVDILVLSTPIPKSTVGGSIIHYNVPDHLTSITVPAKAGAGLVVMEPKSGVPRNVLPLALNWAIRVPVAPKANAKAEGLPAVPEAKAKAKAKANIGGRVASKAKVGGNVAGKGKGKGKSLNGIYRFVHWL
jgi:hypothetical protein